MSKPGPRPFECVKRAWHSERHQPMRGSIIQKILRVATEAHKPETKKNKEWQTKFPKVVMKAEEILYYKANSEDEYKDPDTLWERLNEAINIIIKRDESTENGQYILPCIEAALVVGCVAVRQSRSQQLKNPRRYLNHISEEPSQVAQTIEPKSNTHKPPPRPPYPFSNQLNKRSKTNEPSTSTPLNPQIAPNTSHLTSHCLPHLQPNFTQPINFGSVCPLYYGSQYQNTMPNIELQTPLNPNPSDQGNTRIGRPVGWPPRESSHVGNASTMNLLASGNAEIKRSETRNVKLIDNDGNTAVEDCDLSLRLGPLDSSAVMLKGPAYVCPDVFSSIHQVSGEQCNKTREFCFFPVSSTSDKYESHHDLDKIVNNGEFEYKSETFRKGKLPEHQWLDSGSIEWPTNRESDKLGGKST